MSLIKNLLLTIIALFLFFPLTIINLIYVWLKGRNDLYNTVSGYFFSTALNIDKFANSEFRGLWNRILIKQNINVFKFGNPNETISYCLGKNKETSNL